MANGTLAVSQLEILSQSGTGIVTIVPPATNTNRTLTLPDSTGTLLNNQSNILTQTKAALNASNDAPIYACRAWVNFNGVGTVAIRGTGNVSSITDNGAGDYTVNFTTAMPDVGYSFVASCMNADSGDISLSGVGLRVTPYPGAGGSYTMSTTAIRLQARYQNATNGAVQDHEVVTVAIFR